MNRPITPSLRRLASAIAVLAVLVLGAAWPLAADEGKRLSSSELRDLKKGLEKALSGRDAEEIEKQIKALSSTGDPRAVEAVIADALLGDDPVAVRVAGAALGEAPGEKAGKALTDAYKDSKKAWQKLRLLGPISKRKSEVAAKAVREGLRDKYFAVRERCFALVGELRIEDLQESCERGAKDDHPRVAAAASASLVALGGEAPAKAPGAAAAGGNGHLPGPLPTAGVVFLIDANDSMHVEVDWPEAKSAKGEKIKAGKGPKYGLVIPDIVAAVAGLDDESQVDLATFQVTAKWFARKKPAKGGAKSAAAVEDWLRGHVRNDTSRETLRTVQAAIDKEWVDTIVLVTDGLPKGIRDEDAETVLRRLYLPALDAGVVIHTVALLGGEDLSGLSGPAKVKAREEKAQIVAFCEDLAAQAGGTCQIVDVPARGEGGGAATAPAGGDGGGDGGKPPSGGGEAGSGGTSKPAAKRFKIELRGGTKADASEVKRAKKALAAAIDDRDWDKVEEILTAMGTCNDPKVADLTIDEGLFHPSPRVSDLALDALESNPEPRLHEAIVKRCKKEKNPERVFLLVSALAPAIGEEGAELISRFLTHDSRLVRSKAARLLGSRPQPDIEALADAIRAAIAKESSLRVKFELNRALVSATGEAVKGFETGRAATELLPTRILSDRVVFVVDVHDSMKTEIRDPRAGAADEGEKKPASGDGAKPPPGKRPRRGSDDEKKGEPKKKGSKLITRGELVERSIFEAIKAMPAESEIDVIAIQSRKSLAGTAGDGKLIGAGEKGANRAADYLQQVSRRGGSERAIVSSVRAALANPDVDTIYLFLDGLATRADVTDPAEVISRIRELNRTRDAKIHVVGLIRSAAYDAMGDADRAQVDDDERAFKEFARELANVNGGEIVIIRGSIAE